MALSVPLPDTETTTRLGVALADHAGEGVLLRLHGILGAGKTALVQGIAAGLGIPDGAGVRSPSFALMRIHDQGRIPLVHVDLYRLGDPGELDDLGLDDWIGERALVAVEWADRFPGVLPDEGLVVCLEYTADGGRVAHVTGHPEGAHDAVIEALARAFVED